MPPSVRKKKAMPCPRIQMRENRAATSRIRGPWITVCAHSQQHGGCAQSLKIFSPLWVKWVRITAASLTVAWVGTPVVSATKPTPQASFSRAGSYRPCLGGCASKWTCGLEGGGIFGTRILLLEAGFLCFLWTDRSLRLSPTGASLRVVPVPQFITDAGPRQTSNHSNQRTH